MSLNYLREVLDSKKISAYELVTDYLDKINKKNQILNCYITVCKDEAINEAKIAQKVIDRGEAQALTGIPLSIKDNICTKNIRTTCASKMLLGYAPVYDATVVKKLKDENAVILGKTNMDEFAMGSDGSTSYFGNTKNPYDINRSAGGSSSGAASAVAAGLCAFSIGTDTGGSVRQPAAMCGVTGLKPTYGTVSRYGFIPFASSLDQIGIIAKSARDTGFVLNSIHGADENDMTSVKNLKRNYLSEIGKSIKGHIIGIADEFFEGASDEVIKSVFDAVDFYKSCGAEIKRVSIPSLSCAVSAYYLISSAEAASNLARFDGIKYGLRENDATCYEDLITKTRSDGFGWEVKRRIMLGNYALSDGYFEDYYNNAVKIRNCIINEFKGAFSECDAILTPTSPHTAKVLAGNDDNPTRKYLDDFCTVGANIAGLPAISTVCGYDNSNMPIGMSLIGRAFEDANIISLADSFEKEFTRQEASI